MRHDMSLCDKKIIGLLFLRQKLIQKVKSGDGMGLRIGEDMG